MPRSCRVLAAGALASPALLALSAQLLPAAAFTIAMAFNALIVLITGTALGLAARHGDLRLRRARLWFATALAAAAAGLAASRDALTGLSNRRSFLGALETSLAERTAGEVAVVLLDLDGFKEVNDSFGHASGDLALRDVADRLVVTLAGAALAARLGGDEFAVLLVGDNSERRAARTAATLVAEQQSAVGVATVSVGASAGVAVSRTGDTASTLLRRADLAMYEAKRAGMSQAAVFAEDMAVRAERRHLLTQALPGAAARGELELVYQPMVRLSDGVLTGAEALLRWRSPVHGDVPPVEFVPLAEETGIIGTLGDWVLASAASQLQQWRAAGCVPPRLSVNVSPHQLTPGFAAQAVRRLEEHGLSPSSITLEITESAMLDLPANRCVERLRLVGFTIAMDDFGAGFSSLAQLAALPVDVLKFDREFIRGVATPNGRRIVACMIAMGADLGLITIAEGIESGAEADVVREAGCELAQGYFFSPPLPPSELTPLLAPQLPAPRDGAVGARVST